MKDLIELEREKLNKIALNDPGILKQSERLDRLIYMEMRKEMHKLRIFFTIELSHKYC